jgi:hypothetical protein
MYRSTRVCDRGAVLTQKMYMHVAGEVCVWWNSSHKGHKHPALLMARIRLGWLLTHYRSPFPEESWENNVRIMNEPRTYLIMDVFSSKHSWIFHVFFEGLLRWSALRWSAYCETIKKFFLYFMLRLRSQKVDPKTHLHFFTFFTENLKLCHTGTSLSNALREELSNRVQSINP